MEIPSIKRKIDFLLIFCKSFLFFKVSLCFMLLLVNKQSQK